MRWMPPPRFLARRELMVRVFTPIQAISDESRPYSIFGQRFITTFMPLASADPFGGVIITDWYTPPGTSGERFKATVYILSRDLRSDGVRVNIYRQVLQNGQWVDATVADSTVGDIENKVLARARRMREQLQTSS